jgi:ABC-type siderophore export system fused ATPase/permease subunit
MNVQEFIQLMELDSKVRIVDRKFDTTALSTGQRKRRAELRIFKLL